MEAPIHRTRRTRSALAAAALCTALLYIGTTASASPLPTETTSVSPASFELWVPPIGSHLTVLGPYLEPPTPYTSGHRGIDLPAGPGLSVRAPASGTVTFVGSVVDRGVLSVRVDEHTVLSFEPIRSDLREGDAVSAGQLLGTVSSGGHCFDECLHLGVRVEGDYVNPLRYFRGRPKLRPW
ncbi:M23 family metallopeptidase [Leucobacter coleopterorum]|uniref:M23 family metallopeptidase n=1 Tax=Leucobacter coleopterorum TaxID=2714933 RepID=A0ABX6JWN7_9MICO|nr:M23 family metallopeptidase [Leucobacter coleopterorum]